MNKRTHPLGHYAIDLAKQHGWVDVPMLVPLIAGRIFYGPGSSAYRTVAKDILSELVREGTLYKVGPDVAGSTAHVLPEQVRDDGSVCIGIFPTIYRGVGKRSAGKGGAA